ncbi:MAG: DNA adenine methylase [Phototrophicaceae bacterium]
MPAQQLSLFSDHPLRKFNYPFPSTRYQGSKRTLTDWIWESVGHLPFDSVLDVFGGTGAVSFMFKNAGKQVIYNDGLAFNTQIGRALVENSNIALPADLLQQLLTPDKTNITYPDFIQRTFSGVYFTDDENRWLDQTVYHIQKLTDPYQQAIAWFALFQACTIKRPYNLFHRANLYMRTATVERSFGNKATWDTPFETHFRQFVTEANAAIFDNGQANQALQHDALDTPTGADLVYLDPPYLNQQGVGVDYRDFYHFLEGLVHYDQWPQQVDTKSKHRRLIPEKTDWNHPQRIYHAFDALLQRHQRSILLVSYRDNGIPTKAELLAMLGKYKNTVLEATRPKQYVLSSKQSNELLLIAY